MQGWAGRSRNSVGKSIGFGLRLRGTRNQACFNQTTFPIHQQSMPMKRFLNLMVFGLFAMVAACALNGYESGKAPSHDNGSAPKAKAASAPAPASTPTPAAVTPASVPATALAAAIRIKAGSAVAFKDATATHG
jgi:hypothetical protein